jgi:hypothetical protein
MEAAGWSSENRSYGDITLGMSAGTQLARVSQSCRETISPPHPMSTVEVAIGQLTVLMSGGHRATLG